jgi:hypothetical protein
MIDFVALWGVVEGKLIVLLILTLLDLLFGILLAVRQKRFEWAKLTGYLDSDIFPILAWMAAEVIGAIPVGLIPEEGMMILPQIVYGTVFLKILASVAGHMSAIGVLTSALSRVKIVPTGAPDGDGTPKAGET